MRPWFRTRPSRIVQAVDFFAASVAAGVCAGVVLSLVDALWRPSWGFSWRDHWLGASALFLALSAVAGSAWALLHGLDRLVMGPSSSPRLRRRLSALFRGVLAAVLFWETAIWTFSGRAISETAWARWGPALLSLAIGLGAFVVSLLTHRAFHHASRRRTGRALSFAAAFALVAIAAIVVDLTVYVALYDRLHDLLEIMAWIGLVTAFAVGGSVFMARRPRQRPWLRVLALLALVDAAAYFSSPSMRGRVDTLLAHGWVDSGYVGRHLRRAQVSALARRGEVSLEMARVAKVRSRFGLTKIDLDPKWLEPARPYLGPESLARGEVRNVAVFYVDTLREDVTRDPGLMPNLARFRLHSLDFGRAYAPGSDTLRSLPALTGGNYFIQWSHPGDLLRMANDTDHRSVLIIPKSARTFLNKLLPEFQFTETHEVADYDDGKKVWGYGAHRPTSSTIVDRADLFLRSQGPDEPFFLWMFHFDQHAWRELDEDYITARQKRLGVGEDGEWHRRYRVVARSVDREFGRFLRTLEESGRAEDTAVLFVSDHGEALGQNGYWVHSIFLWESLIRVPMVLKIPGVPGRRIRTPVSLVDVAPTLAPIFGGGAALYHGEDLLALARDEAAAPFERRLPLLLRGATKDRLGRIGVFDPTTGHKLVFRIEAAFPELYATRTDPIDSDNLARQRPEEVRRMLRQAARSPVFPRSERDFRLLERRGELARLWLGQDGVEQEGREQEGFSQATSASSP